MTRDYFRPKDIDIFAQWLLILSFAYFFVYFISWTGILGKEFVDILNYLHRIDYLHHGGDEMAYTGIKWVLSEPLWRWIVIGIGENFTNPRMALYLVSFVALLLYGNFLFRRVEFYVGIIFLFNPMFVNLIVEQVRIALAFSLVVFAYDMPFKKLSVPLLIMAFLIHASMPIFLGIYFILYKLNSWVEPKKYYLYALFTALFIALFMKYGLDLILTAIGDRHAGYGDIIDASSIAFSIVWFMIAMMLSIKADFQDSKNRILVAYAITIMSFFFFASALDIYGQRYVAVSIPIIIVAISYLPKHYKQATYVALFAYNMLMFKYWLELTII